MARKKRSTRGTEFSEEVVDVAEPTAEFNEARFGPAVDSTAEAPSDTIEPEPEPEDAPPPAPEEDSPEPEPEVKAPPREVDVDAEIAAICKQHAAKIVYGPADASKQRNAKGRVVSGARAAQLKAGGGFQGLFYKLDNGLKVFVDPDKTIWCNMGLPMGLAKAFWRLGPTQADGTPGPSGWFYYHRDTVDQSETGWKKVEDFPKWQTRYSRKRQ